MIYTASDNSIYVEVKLHGIAFKQQVIFTVTPELAEYITGLLNANAGDGYAYVISETEKLATDAGTSIFNYASRDEPCH